MCIYIFSLINVSAQLVEFRRRVVVVQALVHRVQGERLKVLLERLRVLAPRVLADLVERANGQCSGEAVFSVFFSTSSKSHFQHLKSHSQLLFQHLKPERYSQLVGTLTKTFNDGTVVLLYRSVVTQNKR